MKLKQYDFVGKRKIYYIASSVLMVLIVLATLVFGPVLDIEFKGGSIISYTYENTEINTDEVQTLVKDVTGRDAKINIKAGIGDQKDSFDIQLADNENLASDVQKELSEKLSEKYGENIKLLSIKNVDPVIGNEFLAKGLVAVLIAAVLLIIYVGFRFKNIGGISGGVMSVIALIHDVIVVFGTFIIFRIPIDYNFIAVVLTILGYSINDTIVIYDRIRENKRLYPSKSIGDTVNLSINQSLTRSVNTSIATVATMIITCIVALIFNVESIISFAFPMVIGMISGVYSTIFLAGPLWVSWLTRKKGTAKVKKA